MEEPAISDIKEDWVTLIVLIYTNCNKAISNL